MDYVSMLSTLEGECDHEYPKNTFHVSPILAKSMDIDETRHRQLLLGSTPDAEERKDSSRRPGSKHLKVLESAGLIARGREAQWRPCRLQVGPLKEVADWVENYRRFWE
jgi:hypothetical protein